MTPYTEAVALRALRCTRAGVSGGEDLMKLKTTLLLQLCRLFCSIRFFPFTMPSRGSLAKIPFSLKRAKSCQSDPHPYLSWVKGAFQPKAHAFLGCWKTPKPPVLLLKSDELGPCVFLLSIQPCYWQEI